MVKRYIQYFVSVAVTIALLNGCRSAPPAATPSTPGVQNTVKSFKDYPDHAFNPREYIRGMVKGGHNVLIWQDPSVDLRKYRSVNVVDFGGQLLPVQNVFSYDPFVSSFNATFRSTLKLSKENSSDALLIEGAVVECNPGSRGARMWVGYVWWQFISYAQSHFFHGRQPFEFRFASQDWRLIVPLRLSLS